MPFRPRRAACRGSLPGPGTPSAVLPEGDAVEVLRTIREVGDVHGASLAGIRRRAGDEPGRRPTPRGRFRSHPKGCWDHPGTGLALRRDHMRQQHSYLAVSGRSSAARLAGLALAGLFAAAPGPAQAAEGAVAIFRDTCAACHTVGGGESAGPDLVSAASMDRATLRENVVRMQDYAGELTDSQIDGLIDLLSDPQAADRIGGPADGRRSGRRGRELGRGGRRPEAGGGALHGPDRPHPRRPALRRLPPGVRGELDRRPAERSPRASSAPASVSACGG